MITTVKMDRGIGIGIDIGIGIGIENDIVINIYTGFRADISIYISKLELDSELELVYKLELDPKTKTEP